MTDKRLILAPMLFAAPLALLAACGNEAPAGDSRSASGEVLEGTISDAMLPIDTVKSEPPLADPEAFAKAQSGADDAEADAADDEAEGEPAEGDAAAAAEEPASEPAD